MTQFFNPGRLSLARRRRGLTQATLAQAVGVSARMMTYYERGEKVPGLGKRAALARELQVPVDFFSGPDLDEPPVGGSSFRALSNLTARERDQALGAGAFALALSRWIEARFALPDPDVPRYRGVDPETAARGVRSAWGLGERPIRNMVHLLEAHGVRVFSLAEDCLAMDAYSFRLGEMPYVFLNTMKSAERSRMDAAHELGHLVLHWRGEARSPASEREADLFGSAFLMPRDSVIAEAPRGASLDQIIQAKRRWNVAVTNLTRRMHVLGLLTDWQYRSLFIEISRLGYRIAEPNGIQGETSQVLGKVFKALRDEGVTLSHVARELAIYPEDLSKSIFGLVLTPLAGMGGAESSASQNRPTQDRAQLRLL